MYKLFLKLFVISIFFTSCDKDNQGTLVVVNQTDCLHNIYDGVNSSGEFLGPVGANQTATFIIELGSAESISGSFFAVEPVNCMDLFEEQFQVDIENGETSTILIN